MTATSPAYQEKLRQAERLRSEFASEFNVRRIKWSAHNLSRMIRLTGERPPRVAEMWVILCDLGLGDRQWPCTSGVFDHGEMWGRDRIPLLLVGHPYGILDDHRALLAELSRFPGLVVRVDDRPSYYGFGTHHVRVGLAEVRRPWNTPPATPWTRRAARAARKVFAEEMARPD